MKNELKHNQIKELININLKVVDSKEKLVPININDKHFSTKKSKTNIKSINSNLPPIKQHINPNKNRNSTAKEINREFSLNKKEEINDEITDNKSTKNSFNTTDNSLSFKNGTNNINSLKYNEDIYTVEIENDNSKKQEIKA